MSESLTSSSPMSSPTSPSRPPSAMSPGKSGVEKDLVTSQGKTTIADPVVSKIAGIAAREVSGVHALGGGAARAVGALRERISAVGKDHSQGVSVEVGERQAAVDIQLTAEYGVAIQDLAASVRRNVISSIERMTGLEVSEVNIEVLDVYLEAEDSDDQDEDKSPRVQ